MDSDGSGDVAAATLNKLVEKLTAGGSNISSSQYLDFMKIFLSTYHSFTTPIVLLQKLMQRYHVPRISSHLIPFDEYEKLRFTVQLRACNVL